MQAKTLRTVLLIGAVFLSVSLYNQWAIMNTPQQSTVAIEKAPGSESGIPEVFNPSAALPSSSAVNVTEPSSKSIVVDTDLVRYQINLQGGDIVEAQLKEYSDTLRGQEGIKVITQKPERDYIVQSGLISDKGPESREKGRGVYSAPYAHYTLMDNDNLEVRLTWLPADSLHGLHIDKIFLFHKKSYVVEVRYEIHNKSSETYTGNFYGQIRRKKPESTSSMFGMDMYQGGAYFTEDKPFHKMKFEDMNKKPLSIDVKGGWVAMTERYFVTTWLFPQETHHYYTREEAKEIYQIGAIGPTITVAPGAQQSIGASLYIGPEEPEVLKQLAPGLDLTIDYGFLWPISQFLYNSLTLIHKYVGNWGIAIILLTVLIKLVFYKLSASSYRSMAKMRAVQPKMEALRARFGSDKQQFSQALMDLYRKEKINPMGGCLPVLVQIPVFIALYYVLLESIVLRHAPFFGWIQDLSSKDPYYILPALMAASMVIQQRLGPRPSDPIQAKVMQFMPLMFALLCLWFPAGLVLYWFVNTLLSILQQWYIQKSVQGAR